MTTVTIELPDELAQEAESHGLLESSAFDAMIREALRRRAVRNGGAVRRQADPVGGVAARTRRATCTRSAGAGHRRSG